MTSRAAAAPAAIQIARIRTGSGPNAILRRCNPLAQSLVRDVPRHHVRLEQVRYGKSLPRRLPRQIRTSALETRILTLRGRKVLLDADLAATYGVATRVLNQAVRRHRRRFPPDFLIQLTTAEARSLRSQTVISNGSRGGRRYLPYAFTEHGAVMLASILNSPTAITASIAVVRAFIRLRSEVASQHDLLERLELLEGRCDRQFKVIFRAIRALIEPSSLPVRRRIGFRPSASVDLILAGIRPPKRQAGDQPR